MTVPLDLEKGVDVLVRTYGSLRVGGGFVDCVNGAVRPALGLDLSS